MKRTGGVLRIHFTAADLLATRIRAEPDPMWESVLSACRPGLARGGLLGDLIPLRGNFPDFLTPATSSGEMAEGLETIRALPRRSLSHDLDPRRLRRPATAYTRALASGDRTAMELLTAALVRQFRVAVEPVLPVIRQSLAADQQTRLRRFASGGLGGLLEGLAPVLRWRAPYLEADYPVCHEIDLDGRGLELIPSYFCDRTPVTFIDPGLPPVLVFPVRPARGSPPAAEAEVRRLAPVFGRTRALILVTLRLPHSTTELAEAMGMSAATASQQATVLREAGFVVSRRTGQSMVHLLSPLGRVVVDGS
ncbi:winged helix-turn-helix domain-containing protein [Amycolatopsis sp. NBC_00345]|uniref:ArsR/SmtB family transcription factor n=1 Tax=Amycolatopsis sp. NBC_00345 TaxID=2975955 RepID=UPI002E25FFB6